MKKKKNNALSLLGKKGGNATLKNHGNEHMSSIGKKGALKRWKK